MVLDIHEEIFEELDFKLREFLRKVHGDLISLRGQFSSTFRTSHHDLSETRISGTWRYNASDNFPSEDKERKRSLRER